MRRTSSFYINFTRRKPNSIFLCNKIYEVTLLTYSVKVFYGLIGYPIGKLCHERYGKHVILQSFRERALLEKTLRYHKGTNLSNFHEGVLQTLMKCVWNA